MLEVLSRSTFQNVYNCREIAIPQVIEVWQDCEW